MGLFNLIFKFKADTVGVQKGLSDVERASRRTASRIGENFKRFALGALGLRELNAIGSRIVMWSKDIEAAKKEFERLGLTIDENVLRRIEASGNAIEVFKSRIAAKASGPLAGLAGFFRHTLFSADMIFRGIGNMLQGDFTKKTGAQTMKQLQDEITAEQMGILGTANATAEQKTHLAERAKELAKVQLEIEKEQEKQTLKALDNEGKMYHIKRRIIDLHEQQKAPMLMVDRKALELQELQLRGDLQDLRLQRDKEALKNQRTERVRSFGPTALDNLAKVGGFTGAPDNLVVSLQERIAKATEDTAKNTGKAKVQFR